MISYREWKLREMAGGDAIYPGGQKATDYGEVDDKDGLPPKNKRDYNWWGAPETAGMSQPKAHAHMEKETQKHHRKKK